MAFKDSRARIVCEPDNFRHYADAHPLTPALVDRAIRACRYSHGELRHIFERIKPYKRLVDVQLATMQRLLILAPEQARFYFAYHSLLDRAKGVSHRPDILTCFDRESGYLGRLIGAAKRLERYDVAQAWRTVGSIPDGARVLDEDWLVAQRLVRPDFKVFDIGANQGLTALIYRRFAAEVHAFEPNPDWGPLVDPMRAIGIDFHLFGLAEETGRLQLFQTTGNSGSATFHPPPNAGSQALHHSDVRRIDDLGLPPADFWKIDAEGAELAILKGARQTLRSHRPRYIQVELWGDMFFDVFDFLAPHYRYCLTCRYAGGELRFSEIKRDGFDRHYRTLGTPLYVFTDEALAVTAEGGR